jgi:hypothetical protein
MLGGGPAAGELLELLQAASDQTPEHTKGTNSVRIRMARLESV